MESNKEMITATLSKNTYDAFVRFQESKIVPEACYIVPAYWNYESVIYKNEFPSYHFYTSDEAIREIKEMNEKMKNYIMEMLPQTDQYRDLEKENLVLKQKILNLECEIIEIKNHKKSKLSWLNPF